eukprot:gene7740-12210_t
MDYVFDALARVPSQVLVKIIGVYVEESLKNATDDITSTVQDSTEEICKNIKNSASEFGNKFKDGVLDSFCEWGYSLERSFTSLGSRIENGLINSGHKVSEIIESILDKRMEDLTKTIHEESNHFSETLSTTGIEQLKSFKEIYKFEIQMLIYGWIFICLSIFIASLSYSTNFQLFKLIKQYFFDDLKLFLSILFSIIISTSIQKNQNPKILFLIVGSIGFFVGNFANEILLFSSVNIIFIFFILLLVTLIIHKIIAIDILIDISKNYNQFKEFLEWKKNQKE